jgi:thioredoxin reductase (NADPH)
MTAEHEVAAVGGPAGQTVVMYSTRLGHRTAPFDRGGGRAAWCRRFTTWSTSPRRRAATSIQTGKEQLGEYGCDIRREMVTSCSHEDGKIRLCGNSDDFLAEYVVLATGFNDIRPDPPLPRTGRGLHYCLHCDANVFVDQSAYVIGNGESAVHVAGILLNFTDEVDLLTRGDDPQWGEESDAMLASHPIDVLHEDVTGVQSGVEG